VDTVAVSFSAAGEGSCCCPVFSSPFDELRTAEAASRVASMDEMNVWEDAPEDFDVVPVGTAAGGILSNSTMDATCTPVH
jgi:hypothetical protein